MDEGGSSSIDGNCICIPQMDDPFEVQFIPVSFSKPYLK